MKRRLFLVIFFFGIILPACGGGGGGGDSQSGDGPTSSSIYALDYTSNDISKTYTFKETEVITSGGQGTDTSNLVYRYSRVDTIPAQYGYSGKYAGPYTMGTKETGGATKSVTYTISTGASIVNDNFTFFTSIDSTTYQGDSIPPDMVINKEYSSSSTAALFNSDLSKGAFGENIGSMRTTQCTRAIGTEDIKVDAGTFEALKTQDSSTITITGTGLTRTIESSGYTWFGKGMGLVKKVSNNITTISDGTSDVTIESTVTDELTNVN